ncbi:MAG: MFS transporter, partial [Acidobacteria bacterium]
LLFWVDGATCLLAALASLCFFPGSRPEVSAEGSHAEPAKAEWWRDRIFLGVLAVTLGVALVFSQLFSTFGMYLKTAAGLPESRIGGLVAINTGLIVIVQMPLTHGTDRFSRTRLTALGALLLGAGFALMPFGNSLAYLAATVVVWTFGEMLTLPLLTTLTSLRASAAAQGRYQGLYTMSYSMGITAGPALGTWVYTVFGGRTLWMAVGGVATLAAGGMLALSRKWDGRSEAFPPPGAL